MNGPLAKKTQNAFLPSKIAIRSAELEPPAGLSVSAQREINLRLMLLNALKRINVWVSPNQNQSSILWLFLLLRNALPNIVLINQRPALKTLNASLLWLIAPKNVKITLPAGQHVSLKREIKLPLTSTNASRIMTVWIKFNPLQSLLPLLILNNALSKNAQMSGLPVRKILSASLLFKTVKKSVEPKYLAGLFASHQREVKLPLMLLNVLKRITVLDMFLRLTL